MAKIALKKCSFWRKLHFFRCKFGGFWGKSSLGALGVGGIEKYIEVVSVII